MTAADAAKLARTAGVKAVIKDEKRTLDTTRTPEFLGLTKRGGIWDQLGGPSRNAGAGVVVADLDSGLWPENPSVAPLRNPKPVRQFSGTCQTGEQWDASDCTTKVIGARYYTAGVTASIGDIKAAFPYEFISARDADGHGTHTATTAAGNFNVPVTVAGQSFGNASGMAPNARIAVYKICWGRGEPERRLLHLRQRAGDRGRHHRRRRRDQLLDLRQPDQLGRRGRGRVLRRGRRPACSCPPRPATTARARPPSRTTPRGR